MINQIRLRNVNLSIKIIIFYIKLIVKPWTDFSIVKLQISLNHWWEHFVDILRLLVLLVTFITQAMNKGLVMLQYSSKN
jgi:hypothetical protein